MKNKYNRFMVVDSYGFGIFGMNDASRVYYGNDAVRAMKKAVKYLHSCDGECRLRFYDLAARMDIYIYTDSVQELLNSYHAIVPGEK